MTNLFPLACCAKVIINLFNSLPDITQNFLPLFCRWLKRSCRDNKQHFIRVQANKSDVFLVMGWSTALYKLYCIRFFQNLFKFSRCLYGMLLQRHPGVEFKVHLMSR